MKKALIAAAALVVVVVVAIGAWLVFGGGDDEKTTRGTCGNATYELSTESEDSDGVEVSFELQSASPGETWDVVVEQDGSTVLDGERQTDEDAELDVDVTVAKSDGTSFTVTATPKNGEACTASLDH